MADNGELLYHADGCMAEWAGLRRRTCTRAKPALPPRPGLLRHERSVLSTSHDKKAPVCQHFYTPVNECVALAPARQVHLALTDMSLRTSELHCSRVPDQPCGPPYEDFTISLSRYQSESS